MPARCKAKIGYIGLILFGFIFSQSLQASYDGKLLKKRNDALKITQYLDPASDSKLVMLSAGLTGGLMNGLTLNSYRNVGNQKIETGQLKITYIKDHYAIAEILSEETPFSRAIYAKFPGVMAGDYVEQQKIFIAKRKIVIPESSIGYHKIFEDPKSSPSTYELSEIGKEEIIKAAKPFLNAHISMLMVEGHTDHNGLSSDNQIESYQRALTIRQFIIDELHMNEDRIIAVGFGESEIIDDSYVAGYRENNRRIVFKTVQIH